jgi:hypothetical protein
VVKKKREAMRPRGIELIDEKPKRPRSTFAQPAKAKGSPSPTQDLELRNEPIRAAVLLIARPRGGLSGGTNPIPRGDGLLAPVYGWFTEGFDTRDLKAAKALLEELTE